MSSTGSVPTGNAHKTKPPFLAFTSDAESVTQLQQFAAAKGWDAACIRQGDIDAAAEHMKSSPSPEVLFIDVNSVESAPASFDKLADVCDPGVKVIVSGKINEYSFYCWLVDMGISSYLLKPLTQTALENAWRKATEVAAPAAAAVAAAPVTNGKVISVIGSRGGVGATTICTNLAWILAHQLEQKTALLDFDAQLGTVALSLDLEPGRGLRDALEKPERIDGLFLDRVMVKLDDQLSILSTEEGMEENITPNEGAVNALFTQTRPKYTQIVVDVPRFLTPFTRLALSSADHIVCVTELSLMGLRESLRYLEYCRDVLKVAPPIFVANKVGVAGKHQMPQSEFEKGLGAKIDFTVPLVPDAHAASTAGQVLVETAKNSPAVKALAALAARFVEGAEEKLGKQKSGGKLSFLKKGK